MSDERETYRGLVEDLSASHRAVAGHGPFRPGHVTIYGRAAEAIGGLIDEVERLRAGRSSRIEPCPSCMEAISLQVDGSGGGEHKENWQYVECQGCKMCGPWRASRERAIKAWNLLPR